MYVFVPNAKTAPRSAWLVLMKPFFRVLVGINVRHDDERRYRSAHKPRDSLCWEINNGLHVVRGQNAAFSRSSVIMKSLVLIVFVIATVGAFRYDGYVTVVRHKFWKVFETWCGQTCKRATAVYCCSFQSGNKKAWSNGALNEIGFTDRN
jgi:hypothetical protein